jgi:antitoxin (DNA-binding transcriptional repressor) of toxin-antitoxin stability system
MASGGFGDGRDEVTRCRSRSVGACGRSIDLLLELGKPRQVRDQPASLVESLPRLIGEASVERRLGPEKTPFSSPPPHPALEALPLAGCDVRCWNGIARKHSGSDVQDVDLATSRCIRRIEAGERIAITAHGRVVAELVPPGAQAKTAPSRFDELVGTLDAVHLATTELLGEPPPLIVVVTRDGRVRENAEALGYAVE